MGAFGDLRVHSLTRQHMATGMAEHVDVDRKRNASLLACPLDHPRYAFPLKGITPLVYEDIPTLAR